jgi:hypothetical protein
MRKSPILAFAALAPALWMAAPARAAEVLRFASTGVGWDNAVATFGVRQGFLREAGT